jgi:tetratricopeptide (TPR) repeat protein
MYKIWLPRSLLGSLLMLGVCQAQGQPAISAGSPAVTPPAGATGAVPVKPHGAYDPHAALDPERLAEVAVQHRAEGRLPEAMETLNEAIGRFPEDPELRSVRGSLFLEQDRVTDALGDFEASLQMRPDDARPLVNRSQAYRRFGRDDEALTDLDRAVEQEGYRDVPPQPNELFLFEHAFRTIDGRMEVRFAIRPLGRIRIDYEDPHNAAPEPEHLFPLLFQSLTDRLSGGGHSPHREYPADRARSLFGADWAAAAVFDVVPEFGSGFGQALLVALHGSGKADAYTIFLFDDYEGVKDVIDNALSCLSFQSADAKAVVADE